MPNRKPKEHDRKFTVRLSSREHAWLLQLASEAMTKPSEIVRRLVRRAAADAGNEEAARTLPPF